MDDERISDVDEPIIAYPVRADGSLVSRGQGVPALPGRAPGASQPGSVHWAATLMFGSAEKFVQTVESVVAGQGQLAEAEWQRFCVLYREWQRRRRAGELKRDPTLNDVAVVLKLDQQEFFGRISNAIQGLFTKIALMKAVQLAPEVIDWTAEAAKDGETGGKDRELLLKIAGVTGPVGPSVVVNNNTQVGVKVDVRHERLAGPLGQFRETLEDVDNEVREAAKQRAELPPASMEGVIDADTGMGGIRNGDQRMVGEPRPADGDCSILSMGDRDAAVLVDTDARD